jgi:hypothetical protein
MRAYVVYESMFGNTQKVAEAIAEGLSEHLEVQISEVGVTDHHIPEGESLLVVGGPTHAHGMTRPGTRKSPDVTKRPGGPVSAGLGVREWIKGLGSSDGRIAVATFDTRFDKPVWLTGSAARGAARGLKRLGFRSLAAPQSFFVSGTSGPLRGGELERAREWGARLAVEVVAGAGQTLG